MVQRDTMRVWRGCARGLGVYTFNDMACTPCSYSYIYICLMLYYYMRRRRRPSVIVERGSLWDGCRQRLSRQGVFWYSVIYIYYIRSQCRTYSAGAAPACVCKHPPPSPSAASPVVNRITSVRIVRSGDVPQFYWPKSFTAVFAFIFTIFCTDRNRVHVSRFISTTIELKKKKT